MAHRLRQPLEPLLQEEALSGDQHPKVEPPDDEVPARAMPESGEPPDDEEIPEPVAPVSAERDIDIVAKEGAERDVPAAPEIGRAAGHIGVVKVLGVVEAEHPAHADGHVGIAGEIEVDLKGEGEQAKPGAGRTDLREVAIEPGLYEQRGHIGDTDFFEEPLREPAKSAPGAIPRMDPVIDFGGNLGVADDRTGDELVKEAHKEQELERRPSGGNLAAIDVDHVGDGLKGIEGDADRQRDIGNRQRNGQHRIEGLGDERAILEGAQEPEIDGQAGDERGLGLPFAAKPLHQKAMRPVHARREQQQDDPDRLSPRVENERDEGEDNVPIGDVVPREVEQRTERKKEIEKYETGEDHGSRVEVKGRLSRAAGKVRQCLRGRPSASRRLSLRSEIKSAKAQSPRPPKVTSFNNPSHRSPR